MAINSKEFYIAVKNGIGTKEFMDSNGISTPELLEDLAYKFFGSKEARRVISSLEKNDKRRSKTMRVEANTKSIAETAISEPAIQTIMETTISESDAKPIAETAVSEPAIQTITETAISEPNTQPDIEKIANKLKELSSSIIALEIRHNEYAKSNMQERYKLCEIQKSLEKLQEEIEKKKEDFENIGLVISDNYSKMSEINAQIHELRAEQKLFEEEYEKLRKVTVFIYSSDLACEGFRISQFPKEKIQEVLARIFVLPNITEYSVALNELNTLCKLTLLVEELKEKELKTELVFEKTEMQRLFEAL